MKFLVILSILIYSIFVLIYCEEFSDEIFIPSNACVQGTSDKLESFVFRPRAVKFDHFQTWFIYLTATYTSTYSTTTSILTTTEVDSETVVYTYFNLASNEVPNSYYTTSPPVQLLELPLTFELVPSSIYDFFEYNSAVTTVVDNPDKSGINVSDKVALLLKPELNTAYCSLSLSAPIDFTFTKTIKMKVWTTIHEISIISLILGGAIYDPSSSDNLVVTSLFNVSSTWTDLTFNFSRVFNPVISYQSIAFKFFSSEFHPNETYYFDDVRLSL